MKQSFGSPCERFTICHWSEGEEDDLRHSIVDEFDARIFLGRHITDPSLMAWLRRWGHEKRNLSPVQMTDYGVIEEAAKALVTGELFTCPIDRPDARRLSYGVEVRAPEKEDAPKPRRRSPGPSAPKPKKSGSQEEPLDLDIEAQVEALRAAAKDGAPFCEQCTRAALKAQKNAA